MTHLPDEILCIVCTQLWHLRDFNTLFSCARSGKRLAIIALTNLYRIQGVAVKWASESDEDLDSDSDGEYPDRERFQRIIVRARMRSQDRSMRQSAGLWRTIILSSLGKTLYPYSQYIRALNLRELGELLIDENFNDRFRRYFFRGALSPFKIRNRSQLDAGEAINRIGEAITKQTPLLEELIGNVPSELLSQWIPRLPRLTNLETSQDAITLGNATLIRLHCPSFRGLHLPNWLIEGSIFDPSGQGRAAFLNELRPQSIESFDSSNYCSLGPELFQALARHEESLTELKLQSSSQDNHALLKGCTNLVSLSLGGNWNSITEHDNWRNNAFRETFPWLMECKKLRNLASSGSLPWLPRILLENSIHLTSLECESFEIRGSDKSRLYQALACQTSLQSLWLKGCMNRSYEAKPDVLVERLSKLINLTDLRLDGISEDFMDRHIVQLAGSLPKLKSWSTRGLMLTDAIWSGLVSLWSLQRLYLRSSASFTADGILSFIYKLRPGNNGLVLCLVHEGQNSEDEYDEDLYGEEGEKVLSWEDRHLIQKTIAEQVDGSFEFDTSNYV